MTPITQCIIGAGFVDASEFRRKDFRPDCVPGDRQTVTVPFNVTFPTGSAIRVIVTASDRGIDPGAHNAALVGVVQNQALSTFDLMARNSDCGAGQAGFHWLAVAQTPGQEQLRSVAIRMGAVQPKIFAPDCGKGIGMFQALDTHDWGVGFSPPFQRDPAVLLTACKLNCPPPNVGGHYFRDYGGLTQAGSAVVGIAQRSGVNGFNARARNSDCGSGWSALYYVGVTQVFTPAGPAFDPQTRNMVVDTGAVGSLAFEPHCKVFDWVRVDIQFSRPFLTPPVVLISANDAGERKGNVAAVGIAADVTPWGFTLLARNSDCAAGHAGFYWVAFGCAEGCG